MRSLWELIRLCWLRNDFLIICTFVVVSLTVYHRLNNVNFFAGPKFIPCDSIPYKNNVNRFSGNVNYEAAVPNIVHYIRFGRDAKCFTSEQANGLLSVIDNHAPFRVYIHTDNVASVQYNIDRLFSKRVRDLIEVRHYPQPNHIFGLTFSEVHRDRHAVDFTKLKVLRRYGGIYLESNVRLFRNLRKFLNMEMTVVVRPRPSHEMPVELTDDMVIAHKDARFLSAWLKSYHEYNGQDPKHAAGAVMEATLKRGRSWVHIHQQDLPANMDSNGDQFEKVSKAKKYFFATTKDNTAQCL